VTETGEVAIMMVEAESTEATWGKVQSRHAGPDRGDRRPGSRGVQEVIAQLIEAQAELARVAAKPVVEFPAVPRL
jgi:polyribonucleotide nucleotidyltransferase